MKQAIDEFLHEISDADTELLLESVMAGCAIVAYADGGVAAEERKRMMSLIHRFEPFHVFARATLADSFERATFAFEGDRHAGERNALQVVGRLRKRRRHAVMLLKTCQAIASADGFVDPREWHALVRICRSLDLDPADYELLDDPRPSRQAAS
ncbi:MAG: tellurite resistance TerB family protein [Dongiaceae bacterium]